MKTKQEQSWSIPASAYTKRCCNPIRSIVEGMKLNPNPEKPMIAVSVGDPTVFGNLKTCNEAMDAVIDAVKSYKCNGYAPSTGYPEAKEAIAKYMSRSGEKVEGKDVVICSGCSHAIEMCITVLANPGQNILVPKPGFCLYKMIADCLGVNCKFYDLLPEQNWEADLYQMERLIDSQTAAIIVNNPSNPCGSVFSKRHLLDILDIASRNCVPIIADEVYEHLVFKGQTFYSLGSLSTDVPILTCGGLAKRFLVPGWRLGWIIVHDRHNAFQAEISKGLVSLSQQIMGSNTLIQGALPAILSNTPTSFYEDTIAIIEENAKLAYDILSKTPGLNPVMPTGAMYMMVGIEIENFPEFKTDLEFIERLVTEQSIFCLPGMIFQLPGYVRIVLTLPETLMEVACERFREFCMTHYYPQAKAWQCTLESSFLNGVVANYQGLSMSDTVRLEHLDKFHGKNGFRNNGTCNAILEDDDEEF